MMGWVAPFRHRRAKLVFCRITRNREPSMSEVTTIGLDLAKHVFQVHGVDAQGMTVVRKRLRRGQVLAFFSRIPRCVIGLEACATAHYWARELGALGHEVRLMPRGALRRRQVCVCGFGKRIYDVANKVLDSMGHRNRGQRRADLLRPYALREPGPAE